MISDDLNIVIFGAGGHAKVVADIILSTKKYNISAFVDDSKKIQSIWNIPVISESDFFEKKITNKGLVAIGDNFVREKVANKIKNLLPNFIFITAIHPTAYVATDTQIKEGTVIMANSTINPSSIVGTHCIINTNSSVDHDCIIHDFASLAPNSCIGGNCEIGKSSAISIGATLFHRIKIGENVIVGGGSVVTKDMRSKTVVYGVPAKVIRERNPEDKYL